MVINFNGCVRYIFASLFFKSEGEHLRNNEKCLFHFKSSFCSFSSDLFLFLFIEDHLKIQKGLELVSTPHFSYNFLIKNFLFINWPNFVTRPCLLPMFFSKMCLVFHAWAFNDTITFEYLKS